MTRQTSRRPFLAAAVLLLALGACSQSPNQFRSDVLAVGQGLKGSPDASFAVSHRFTLLAPNAEIDALQQRHMSECKKLGCSILNTSVNRPESGAINAHASVRIKPESYDAFAAVLAAPPAKVTFHSEAADDLAVPLLDTEKRLAAKTSLRERLTALLNDQNTKTAADLIAIEKELSQVQGDIEAMTAQLDNLHRRTDAISVDITYVGAVGRYGVDLAPLREAANGVAQTFIRSLSALIYCLAAVAAWLPILAIIWWVFRRGLRRWRSPNA